MVFFRAALGLCVLVPDGVLRDVLFRPRFAPPTGATARHLAPARRARSARRVGRPRIPSVVMQWERARGRCPSEGRRLLVDRAREDKDHSFDIADHAGTGAEVGRDRCTGVGEVVDAVPAHAARDAQKPRQRLRGRVRREPGPGGPPPGMSLRHFACAALNAGDEGFISACLAEASAAIGSGKLGRPLERMHLAKAISACWGFAVLSGVEPLLSELADVAPFPVERWATVGLDEPPQPAASVTHARAAGGARALVAGSTGWWGSCVASGLLRGLGVCVRPGPVLRGGLFRPCFVLRPGNGLVWPSWRNSVETLRRYLHEEEP